MSLKEFVLLAIAISTAHCDKVDLQEHCMINGVENCDRGGGKDELYVNRIYPELLGLDQHSPKLIEALKNKILIPPQPKDSLNLTNPDIDMSGQFNQAKEIKRRLRVKKKKPGFFIEAGAADGENLSNTLFLEVKHGWTGLLVEANPTFVNNLFKIKRNAWVLPHCLSISNRSEVQEFDAADVWGGIINKEDESKTRPGDLDWGGEGPTNYLIKGRKTIKVQCFPTYSVLAALGNPTVDYFSLDVEGAEFPILKTIPWDKMTVKLLGIEINHLGKVFEGTWQDVSKYLFNEDFIMIAQSTNDMFYEYSP